MFFKKDAPNIRKLISERDVDGLVRCLEHHDPVVQLEAAEALAGVLNDGRGWRYLLQAVSHPAGMEHQAAAAEILGTLNHPRAVDVLKEALPAARGTAREAIEEALRSLGVESSFPGPAQEMEVRPASESYFTTLFGGGEVLQAEEIEPVLPNTEIEIHSAEQHLESAAQLRENELQERGLVEICLALWLAPEWGDAWYLRGVLLEDLEREQEAVLAYRAAVQYDPNQVDAAQALEELEENLDLEPKPYEDLLRMLVDENWTARRDAAALLGEWLAAHGQRKPNDLQNGVEGLVESLLDPEREVRHAAVEALGKTKESRTAGALKAMDESSWLMRFAIIQALSDLGSLEELVNRLRLEMDRMQERNPVFASQKDPLLELEFDLLLEVGTLALERTGKLEGLLELAEGNAWEEGGGEEVIEEESEEELDEDIFSFVDEVSLMAAMALDRLAQKSLNSLSREILERLSVVPDLTLLELENDSSKPVVVYDLSELRKRAQAALGG